MGVFNGIPEVPELILIVSVEIVEDSFCQGILVEAIGLFFGSHEIGQSICGVALVVARQRPNERVDVRHRRFCWHQAQMLLQPMQIISCQEALVCSFEECASAEADPRR